MIFSLRQQLVILFLITVLPLSHLFYSSSVEARTMHKEGVSAIHVSKNDAVNHSLPEITSFSIDLIAVLDLSDKGSHFKGLLARKSHLFRTIFDAQNDSQLTSFLSNAKSETLYPALILRL